MSKQKTLLLLVLLAVATAVGLYRMNVYKEAAPGPKPKLVIVTGGSGPYWQLIADGAQTAAKELGLIVDVKMPSRDEDLEAQMMLLNGIDLQAVDAIAVSPLDAEAQTRTIDRLAEEAHVVTLDSDAPLSARLSYVGASNYAAGDRCARLVREAIPTGGEIAVLMANTSKENMQERRNGFQQALSDEAASREGDAAGAIEVVGYLIDEGDDKRCEKQLRQLLAEHSSLRCLVGMNARHGPIALDVLGSLERLGDIKLVTFDTPEQTLQGIEAGHVFATVAQDPYQYGYEATRLLSSYCQRAANQLPPSGLSSTMYIKTQVLQKENIEEYRSAIKRRVEEASVTSAGGASKATGKAAHAN